jgi:serine/threonine protein kinase
MDLLGKTIGNYRIDCLLGEGGMGEVYQAHDLSLQRDVAIKFIHEHIARRPNLRERFLQEARLMAHLDHPGIVKVFTVNTMGELLYIVMEFIPGHNLHQLLEELKKKNTRLPLQEALYIVEQLSYTLEYAHQHKVLHRDIKPSNLMLKREPGQGTPFRVVLTDLGLAKLLEGQGLTQERSAFGTPAYMSPEQASGQDTDARSEVYSLGVLLYELAVGRLPYPIRTVTDAVRYHTKETPPAPRSIRPDLPEQLERVILKAMEKQPSNRYPSAAALGTVLAGISSASTELLKSGKAPGDSLITVYEKSLSVPPSRPRPGAGKKTVMQDGLVPYRGESVFGVQSITPSTQTRIQAVYKGKPAQIFPLPPGTISIGRDAQNDIALPDPKISQRHLQVTWDGLEYHVTDLNSTNGTYVGNTKLLPGIPEVWPMNQNLRLGDTWLRLLRPTGSIVNRSVMGSKLGASALFKSAGAGHVGVIITPQLLKVEAGGVVTGTLSLINQGQKVDHFTLTMTGIPTSWITTLPPSVQLMPGNQTEAVFSLRVPRVPQSKAGQHTITLRVTSQSEPGQFVEAKLILTIDPYSQFSVELHPQRLQAGQKGRLTIFNQGNSNQIFTARFQDREDALDFRLLPRELPITEGQSGMIDVIPTTRKRIWFGSDKSYPITAEITTTNAEPQTQTGEVVAHALLPRWVIPIALFLCISLSLLGGRGYMAISAARQTQTAVALSTVTFASEQTATAVWLTGDDDRDSLSNGQEIELKTFPDNRDTDADGLDDGQEVNKYHSNPLLSDTDGDGLKDGDETAKGLDPLKVDSDNDGVPDNLDSAPAFTPTSASTLTFTPTNTATNTPTTPQPVTPTPYVNNFEGSVGNEWTKTKITTAPVGRKFLGDFGNEEEVKLKLENLPVHTTITLNFDLYILRSWDGNGPPENNWGPDIWTLKVLGSGERTLLAATFCNIIQTITPPPVPTPSPTPAFTCQQSYPDLFGAQNNHPPREGADEINTLGFEYNQPGIYVGVADTVYNLSFSFPHSGTSLELSFSASDLEKIDNESWGLDNVEVIYK